MSNDNTYETPGGPAKKRGSPSSHFGGDKQDPSADQCPGFDDREHRERGWRRKTHDISLVAEQGGCGHRRLLRYDVAAYGLSTSGQRRRLAEAPVASSVAAHSRKARSSD